MKIHSSENNSLRIILCFYEIRNEFWEGKTNFYVWQYGKTIETIETIRVVLLQRHLTTNAMNLFVWFVATTTASGAREQWKCVCEQVSSVFVLFSWFSGNFWEFWWRVGRAFIQLFKWSQLLRIETNSICNWSNTTIHPPNGKHKIAKIKFYCSAFILQNSNSS